MLKSDSRDPLTFHSGLTREKKQILFIAISDHWHYWWRSNTLFIQTDLSAYHTFCLSIEVIMSVQPVSHVSLGPSNGISFSGANIGYNDPESLWAPSETMYTFIH